MTSNPLTIADITREALKVLEAEFDGAANIVRYYKVRQLDGTYCICKGYPNGPIVKDKLSEEEANTYLKLLKEQ